MKKFDPYNFDSLFPDFKDVDKQILSFFKQNSITKKELVIVDENHDESPLFTQLSEMTDDRDKQKILVTDNGVTLFIQNNPFPLIKGYDDGFTFFILHRDKALGL